jgi:hypothetical protein
MDNRIQLNPTATDFTITEQTGQTHDTYPAPGNQLRYDHLRTYLIGLLSHQSSDTPPTQYRTGTVWHNTTTNTLHINIDNTWEPIAKAIGLADNITLQAWYTQLQETLTATTPDITFSGTIATANTLTLTIPTSLQGYIHTDTQPFLYLNGLLQDPRTTKIIGTSTITLQTSPTTGTAYTAILKRIPTNYNYQPNVPQ